MTEEQQASTPEPERPTVTVVFKKPFTMPGTPEAHRRGCLCNFERNLQASIIAAEKDDGMTMVVIHQDCPLHEIISIPDDPGELEQ